MHKVQDHSSTTPFRPIVSSIGTYNYNLAKYLCTLLNPHIPNDYCTQDTFTFVSAGCIACYIGETNRHFATRIREHLASDKHSHIFKHLRGSENCRSLRSEDCVKILDSTSTSFQLKIKEAMHILWEQPSLNSQVKHLNLSLHSN